LHPCCTGKSNGFATPVASVPYEFVSGPLSGAALLQPLGDAVGLAVGEAVGVGLAVGVAVGVGLAVGDAVGVGLAVGFDVGVAVGVGLAVGLAVGVGEGDGVGPRRCRIGSCCGVT
jgi:hypothetical protein